MPSRWKHDRPPALAAFLRRFPDDRACADCLFQKRWPNGFVCPECGGVKGWELGTKKFTWECAACGQQISVTAGTVMHRSKVALRTWFLAAHPMATHSNGLPALQMQAHLGLGSYKTAWQDGLARRLGKTAWLLCHKLRRAMVDPDREPLAGVVEADETSVPLRTKDEPVDGGAGRRHVGKLLIAGAVELTEDGRAGRIRLTVIEDYSATTLSGFVNRSIGSGAKVVSDGWSGYQSLKEHKHETKVVGAMAAHVLLPWIHRVFANLKRWGTGVLHGFHKAPLERHLQEFVFRWNRRRHTRVAFDSLLGIATALPHASYRDFVEQRA
jgi:ISXO2-like transposase domain/Transposase zinc-ribbon domain